MPWAALSAEVAREFSELTTPGGVGMEELHWREWQKHLVSARESARVVVHPRPCAQCGCSFTPKQRDGRLCSDTCRRTERRRKVAEYVRKHRLKKKGAVR
jgi:hypothetical protein